MNGGEKYKFTGKTKERPRETLYQIVAIKSFGNIKDGDIGGYIENENNLSHSGNARVYGNAGVKNYKLINIIGLKWDVTITDSHIQIGCEINTIEGWLQDDWIMKKYPGELDWWHKYKNIILELTKERL